MNDPLLIRLADALRRVDGLVALVLGGSRARGTAGPNSDYDVGLYYEASSPLDMEQLRVAVMPLVDDPSARVTALGEWGPWINGGGWLRLGGHKVDLLYRDMTKVAAVIADCTAGSVTMHYQPGHPHGFCSAIWMGEVALCRSIRDPTGAIAALKARTQLYPASLRQALIARFHWEVLFAIENAEIAAARSEQTHIAGCAYRALCCLAQVLFAVNERYLINEKGALAEAATFPRTIPDAVACANRIWAAIGAADVAAALRLLREMALRLDDVVQLSAGDRLAKAITPDHSAR
jgi:hypothetical protein